jgi:hypothetical protein
MLYIKSHDNLHFRDIRKESTMQIHQEITPFLTTLHYDTKVAKRLTTGTSSHAGTSTCQSRSSSQQVGLQVSIPDTSLGGGIWYGLTSSDSEVKSR